MADVKERLMIHVRKGNSEAVAKVLESDSQLVNAIADSAANTVLHRAARFAHVKVVETLIEFGADVNKENKFGMSPMHHAAVAGDTHVIEALMRHGANAGAKDHKLRTPLHWTCGLGSVEATRTLIEKGRAKANVADEEGWTPLHRCCQERPPPEKKKKRDDDDDEEDEDEKTQSVDQQDAKRAEIAEVLLRSGDANASAKEPKGYQTALHLAAINGYAKTVAIILSNSDKVNVDAANKIGQTPLMYACIERHVHVVEALIEAGADLEAKNTLHWDWRPLHWAVLQDDVNIVEILLKAGADAKAKDRVGRTAKVVADEHRKTQVIKLL